MTEAPKSYQLSQTAHNEDINRASDVPSGTLKASKPVHEHIEGNALLVDSDGCVRRLPIASSDPNDPLNYKPWERAAIIVCCCWFCKSLYSEPIFIFLSLLFVCASAIEKKQTFSDLCEMIHCSSPSQSCACWWPRSIPGRVLRDVLALRIRC